jgi:hypothetical protein
VPCAWPCSTIEIIQFADSVIRLAHFFPEFFKDLFGFIAKKLHQDIILVFKIQINGTVGHPCFFGNLRNGRIKKALPGKYFDGRFEDQMIFVVFIFDIDNRPPRWV